MIGLAGVNMWGLEGRLYGSSVYVVKLWMTNVLLRCLWFQMGPCNFGVWIQCVIFLRYGQAL